MAEAKEDLEAARALRNAARELVEDTAGFLRSDVERKGVGQRIAERSKSEARMLAWDAEDLARDHPGKVASGAAVVLFAILAWIFRRPLADALARSFHSRKQQDD